MLLGGLIISTGAGEGGSNERTFDVYTCTWPHERPCVRARVSGGYAYLRTCVCMRVHVCLRAESDKQLQISSCKAAVCLVLASEPRASWFTAFSIRLSTHGRDSPSNERFAVDRGNVCVREMRANVRSYRSMYLHSRAASLRSHTETTLSLIGGRGGGVHWPFSRITSAFGAREIKLQIRSKETHSRVARLSNKLTDRARWFVERVSVKYKSKMMGYSLR